MRYKFRINDIVKAEKAEGNDGIIGQRGVIRCINPDVGRDQPYLIEFDNHVGGHNGNSDLMRVRGGHGWWCSEVTLKLVKRTMVKGMFKVGNRVAVIECEEIKRFHMWPKAIGKIYTLSKVDTDALNAGFAAHFGGNEYCINYYPIMLERLKKLKKRGYDDKFCIW